MLPAHAYVDKTGFSLDKEAGETPDYRFPWSADNALPLFISSFFVYVLGFIYNAVILFVCIHICVHLSVWQRSTKIYNLEFPQVLTNCLVKR